MLNQTIQLLLLTVYMRCQHSAEAARRVHLDGDVLLAVFLLLSGKV